MGEKRLERGREVLKGRGREMHKREEGKREEGERRGRGRLWLPASAHRSASAVDLSVRCFDTVHFAMGSE